MQVKAILIVVIGIAILVFCFSPSVGIYVERFYDTSSSNRAAVTRIARVVGSVVGALFLLIAFTYFLYGH
jgi:uncharacterized membrane protein YhaH (DUF805 family)